MLTSSACRCLCWLLPWLHACTPVHVLSFYTLPHGGAFGVFPQSSPVLIAYSVTGSSTRLAGHHKTSGHPSITSFTARCPLGQACGGASEPGHVSAQLRAPQQSQVHSLSPHHSTHGWGANNLSGRRMRNSCVLLQHLLHSWCQANTRIRRNQRRLRWK